MNSVVVRTWLGILLLLAVVPASAAGEVEIRVRNECGVKISSVKVGGKDYGDIEPGASTRYQTWAKAYRYASVSLVAEGKKHSIFPRDFVGETPLAEGRHTYVLTLKKGQLDISAKVDKP